MSAPYRGCAGRRRLARLSGGLAGVALMACGPVQPAATGGDDPLAGLPACEQPPAAAAGQEAVDWLELPAGTVVTEVADQPPLKRVSAYAAMTPVQLQAAFEARDDLDIIFIENEVFEFEVLATDGTNRTYVRANAMCPEASSIMALTVSEADAAGVQALPSRPSPAPGSAAPG